MLPEIEDDHVPGQAGTPDRCSVDDWVAYNLGNFLRRLALPQSVGQWTLTTMKEKLIKIGAKVVRHARMVTFQMAEVAVPRRLFLWILARIGRLRASPG